MALDDLRLAPFSKITLTQVRVPLRKPFQISGSPEATRAFYPIVVEIQDIEGSTGVGTLDNFPDSTYDGHGTHVSWTTLVKDYVPRVFRYQRRHAFETLDQFVDFLHRIRDFNPFAVSALEMAAWDLIGKREQRPCHELFLRKFYQVYGEETSPEFRELTLKRLKYGLSSKISLGFRERFTDYEEEIETALKSGVTAIKVKIAPNRARSVDLVAKIRAQYPHLILDTDANAAFRPGPEGDLTPLLAVYKDLEAYNVRMHEQPSLFRANHLKILRALQKELKTSLCPDESIHGLWEAREVTRIAHKTSRKMYINTKVHRTGGIREVIRLLAVLHHFNQKNYSHPVIPWAGYMPDQEVATQAAIGLYMLPVRTTHTDATDHEYWFADSVFEGRIRTLQGRIFPTREPGLGFHVNRDKLSQLSERARTLNRRDF